MLIYVIMVIPWLPTCEAAEILNPMDRKIMQLKNMFYNKGQKLCDENPVMARECDTCQSLGIITQQSCCSDMLSFSQCHSKLVDLLEKLDDNTEELTNTIADVVDTPEIKRSFARWGFSKGDSVLPWGKQIRNGKRYGMASGTRFNFNQFRQGNYINYKPKH